MQTVAGIILDALGINQNVARMKLECDWQKDGLTRLEVEMIAEDALGKVSIDEATGDLAPELKRFEITATQIESATPPPLPASE